MSTRTCIESTRKVSRETSRDYARRLLNTVSSCIRVLLMKPRVTFYAKRQKRGEYVFFFFFFFLRLEGKRWNDEGRIFLG